MSKQIVPLNVDYSSKKEEKSNMCKCQYKNVQK